MTLSGSLCQVHFSVTTDFEVTTQYGWPGLIWVCYGPVMIESGFARFRFCSGRRHACSSWIQCLSKLTKITRDTETAMLSMRAGRREGRRSKVF